MELNQAKVLCRACLAEEGTFQSIFLFDSNSEISLLISEMLSSFSMIEVIRGDGLPEQICNECVEKTVKMYLFKLKFEESDIILRSRFNKVSLSNKAETAKLFGDSGIKTESDYNSQKEILIENFDRFGIGNYKTAGNKNMFKNRNKTKISNNNLVLNKHNKIDEFQCITLQDTSKEDDSTIKTAETIKMEDLEIKDENCFQECNEFFYEKGHLHGHISSFYKNQVSCNGVNEIFSRDQYADTKFDLKNKPYGCEICFEGFSQISNLQDHMRTHNTTSSNDFLEKSEIFNDLQKHPGGISFTCPNSPYLMSNEKNYKGETTNKIDESKKKLKKLKNFILQKRSPPSQKPFKCDMCEKKFALIKNLIRHQRSHTSEKPFKCDMCEKEYTRMDHLLRHKKTHKSEKPFECDMCEKKITKKQDSIRHKRTHTGEKPFDCHMCEKKYTRMENLIRHQTSHTGEKPFKCDMCEKKFTQMQSLLGHKKTHTGKNPYQCDGCKKKFIQKQALLRHKKTHTGEKPFKCDMCEKKIYTYEKFIKTPTISYW